MRSQRGYSPEKQNVFLAIPNHNWILQLLQSFLLLLLVATEPLVSQTSAQCVFNQLCNCKYAPNTKARQNNNHHELWSHMTTEPTFQGQFGVITASYDDFVSNKTSRSHVSRLKTAQNTHNIRDVSCINIPFAKVPDFPVPYITHIDMVNAGLESLDSNLLSVASTIESARFMNNRIIFIDEDAFRAHFSNSLKSLDLSYNQLTDIPWGALSRLSSLDWLNLHGNQISSVLAEPNHSLSTIRMTLSTLFLGENDLKEIPAHFFTSFQRLMWLNLNSNQLKGLDPHILPKSIVTLNLANNLITKFPFSAMDNLPALAWFTLRGNYIESIPRVPFTYPKRLDKIDLGENFITSISDQAFNNSLTVNDLHLDYNYIETISDGAFKSLKPRRLYLGMNRISVIEEKAFDGIHKEAELIDLERNRLNNVSWAFAALEKLRYLYLANNRISELSAEVFHKFCATLRALSVSGNKINQFPRKALKNCKQLSHLNIGYNEITKIHPDDFMGWASNLDTLILRNNRLKSLSKRTFKKCPKLRELSLSFNSFEHIDNEAFTDVGLTLESLEISFGYNLRRFPDAAIKPLQKLLWLSLDNNNIDQIFETSLYNQGELQYLNLESNHLTAIPLNLLHKNVHKNLLDVRLSYNHLTAIRSNTFNALARLQTVVLTGNKITRIEREAFRHMPNLVTLILTNNKISSIESGSFVHLDNLQKLELQFNLLGEFSLNAFENCTKYPMHPMSLNLSHNAIRHLTPMNSNRVPIIESLDVGYNQLRKVPRSFLEFISPSLRRLDLSYNNLTEVERLAFKQLFTLQELKLSHNKIMNLAKPAFHGLTSLQILDLSYNKMEVLQFAQFSGLTGLRTVDLSRNDLRSLPRDVFQSTSVESVDLSFNEFVAMPTSALTETSATIRHLNMSYNRIEHVDSTMFANTPHLLSLSLANNRLTILPDNIFIGLGSLLTLDLSHNPIRANFKELFHYVQRLRILKLSNVETDELPQMSLPSLTALDLSANLLRDLPSFNALGEGMPELRHLNISRNVFTHLPAQCWYSLPQLKSLDVSWNPIRVLTKESFQGLRYLQDLTVQHLPNLTRFDADSLAKLSYLKTLNIQSWPTIEKFKFRLGSVVSGISSLKKLSARILEPNGVLYDQIIGAFGPKLRELEISGPINQTHLDAFEGIESYELLLTIKDTNLTSLPPGFTDMFKNVVHFSLDLRNNKIERLSPDVFYKNGTTWTRTGTRVLEGGIALQGNPWSCSCENVWLGLWLRRWMRETLQLHTSTVERGQAIQGIVRTIQCHDQDYHVKRPLVDLDKDVKCYKDMPISASQEQCRSNPVFVLFITISLGCLSKFLR